MIFLNRAGEVLLALRDDFPQIRYPNCWDIPGGHVEEGETPEECICRELMEEIEIQIARPTLFRIYDLPDRIEHTFWQRAEFDLARVRLREGQRLAWFSESHIRSMSESRIAFGFKRVLMDFFRAHGSGMQTTSAPKTEL